MFDIEAHYVYIVSYKSSHRGKQLAGNFAVKGETYVLLVAVHNTRHHPTSSHLKDKVVKCSAKVSRQGFEPMLCWSETPELDSSALDRSAATQICLPSPNHLKVTTLFETFQP